MVPDFGAAIIRSVLIIIALFFITKVLGKKQLSSLSFYEYIVGITIGDIAGSISMDPRLRLASSLPALLIWSATPLIVSLLSLRFPKFRAAVEGKATVFIENGRLLKEKVKKEKYTMDELLEQLRLKSIFEPEDVEFAQLETNGQISVLLKKVKQPVVYEDLECFRPAVDEPKATGNAGQEVSAANILACMAKWQEQFEQLSAEAPQFSEACRQFSAEIETFRKQIQPVLKVQKEN
ncbi:MULTISPECIES: DUF421 domain-containing protein [Bacillus]|uniref:DUF421 domain-containing protein n=1 Tax=Bacillus TaxID=1386 RepID=UPI000C78C788|nr:DUF421 domain-containing protein [Bacillus sp. UMB0728]PLR71672.1 hypothetical protein CYJ37_17495 [Bacillus sp. UMB0728]